MRSRRCSGCVRDQSEPAQIRSQLVPIHRRRAARTSLAVDREGSFRANDWRFSGGAQRRPPQGRLLGSNTDHFARSNSTDGVQGRRHQRTEVFEGRTPRTQEHDTESCASKVLLKLEVLIGRDEYLELLRGTPEQLSVLETRPPSC
jgi:hypothetical protein